MEWVVVLVGLISRARALCGRAIRGLGVSERGIAVVETALVFPILFFLIAGMGEFGLIEINEIVLENAAATGARYAATNPTSWSNATSPASNTIEGIIL